MNYVVIIPAKNEEENINAVIDSILSQNIPPKYVLVADNGSTDSTASRVKSLTKKHHNLICLDYADNVNYSLGGKIARIIREGKKYLDELDADYDFIVKIDADIRFGNDVFNRIFEQVKDTNIGIVSPLPFLRENGNIIYSSTPEWHTSGDFKVYRKTCYEKIGGPVDDYGWDCADNIMAREKGYDTKVLLGVHYEQRRPMGRFSIHEGSKRKGIGDYKLRFSYLYFFIKFIHEIFRYPYITGALYYFYGFSIAHIKNRKRVLSKEQGRILRRLFWSSLFARFRKRRFYVFQKFRVKRAAVTG